MPERSCRELDPLTFFPDLLSYGGGRTVSTNPMMAAAETAALRICSTCRTLDECHEWVMDNVNHLPAGVVGGTTEKDRRRIIKDAATARRIAIYKTAGGGHRSVRSDGVGVD